MNTLNFTQTMTKKVKIFAPWSSTWSSPEPLIQNYLNFKRSSCPGRVMFYEDGSWVDYPSEVVEAMKLGFLEGKAVVEGRFLGANCYFDFHRMMEIDLDSGSQRSISWIDVEGKCFFPKCFVDSCESSNDFVGCGDNFPKIRIDLRIRGNSASSEGSGSGSGSESDENVKLGKRKRENEEMKGSFSSTDVKRQMVGSELQSSRWPKTRVLGAEEKGFEVVKNLFLSEMGILHSGSTVTSVHKCVRRGPLDRAHVEVFLKQMAITKKARGESNMVFAWYGTSAKNVESILLHGFGVTTNSPHSVGHGIGIHLSPIRSPQNSAMMSEVDENGEKHVILCRLILGKCEKVEEGSQQSYPSSVDYDTGVDDLDNPRWYTVWHSNMNSHILPECVISYRPVEVNKNTIHPPLSIGKLFYKLRGCIPQPKLEELVTSWGSCKEGKMGRDDFMRQLRLIVGDDLLRSTIQEIRG